MQDEKKPPVPEPTKPLVSQIVEAVVDGTADIVKGVAVGVARIAESAKKIEVGKAALLVAKKAKALARQKPAKKATTKKSAAKKVRAKKEFAKKAAKRLPSTAAKKSPAKKRR